MKTLVKYLILILIVSLLPDSGFGQQGIEFIGRGEYVMGDGETPAVAEERALKLAERDAAEQAGVFIKSSTLVKNQTVVEDVIETVASQSMSVQVLEKKRIPLSGRDKGIGEIEALKFSVRIKATLRKSDIEENLKKNMEDSRLADGHRKLKEEYERQAKEIEKQKKKLVLADTRHRQEIVVNIALQEKHFEAVRLVEKGQIAMLYYDKMTALESFSSALSLHPEFAYAYAARGATYLMLNEKDKARADMQKAIDLDPKSASYYAGRAATYGACTESTPLPCKQALTDLSTAISLQPNASEFYLARANIYLMAKNNKKAMEDLTRVTDTDRNAYWPGNAAQAFMMKTRISTEDDLYGMMADITAAISITTNSKYYREVLKPISKLLNDVRENRITEAQAKEIAAKSFQIDPSSPEPEEKRIARTDNLTFVSALYLSRADIYTKLGHKDKAEKDLKTACSIIWLDFVCETPSAPKAKMPAPETKSDERTGSLPSVSAKNEIRKEGRFIANHNGTITDTSTTLMWASKDSGRNMSWEDAKYYCENYRDGGYTDWRMPTQDELAGLYDANKSRAGACEQSKNIHVATELIELTCFVYWASETQGKDAAIFHFEFGGRGLGSREIGDFRALPVRSAK